MKVLFQLRDEDAQYLAVKMIGRELSDYELERVTKGLEFGLECWEGVMIAAIWEIADEK